MFLTDDQLILLTGYKHRHKQIAWLREREITHLVSGAGKPVVALREIEGRLPHDPAFRSKDRPKLDLVR
ncbi:MAG: DUF4224 domain-containing protein [Pseudomonadota bacterium]|nr:DUF4224 domain-containing protein [Pseudomonadota bacterium]